MDYHCDVDNLYATFQIAFAILYQEIQSIGTYFTKIMAVCLWGQVVKIIITHMETTYVLPVFKQ